LLAHGTDDGHDSDSSSDPYNYDDGGIDDDDDDGSSDRREPSIAAHLLAQSVHATRPRATAALRPSSSSINHNMDADKVGPASDSNWLVAAPMVYFCVVAVEPASLGDRSGDGPTVPFRVDVDGGRTAVRTEGSGACV
jgi:hypothetical protein